MKKVIGMLCAFVMCAGMSCQFVFAEDQTDTIYFEDKTLEQLVLQKVDNNGDGKVSKDEMKYLHTLDASGQGIESLVGMEYANLVGDPGAGRGYDFSDNQITDISPIIPAIKRNMNVDLRNNQITDFSLLSQCNLYSVAYSGNPASADEYFKAWNLPSDIYFSASTDDEQASMDNLMYVNPYGFVEQGDLNAAFGFSDFTSDDESIAHFGFTGVDNFLIAGEKVGETNVYIYHGNEKHTIRVHVGNPNATVSDVVAKDTSVKVDAHTRQNILDFLEPDSALWTVSDYTWESSNEEVIKVDGDELVFVGNGQATITGTPKTKTYSLNENGVISFTITVDLNEKQTPSQPETSTPPKAEAQPSTPVQEKPATATQTDKKDESQETKVQKDIPQTSDTSLPYLYGGLLIVSAGYVMISRRKLMKK